MRPGVRVVSVERDDAGYEVLPGMRAFQWLEFVAAVDDPDCTVSGRLEMQGFRGPYRLTRFTVGAGAGMWPACLTGEALRAISVEEVVKAVLAGYGVEPGEGRTPPVWHDIDNTRSGAELRAAGTGDDTVLSLVAATYMAALLTGGNPAEEVAARLEASPATAGRFIKAAKRRGHLRPTDRSV
jgi:hypothetical protein